MRCAIFIVRTLDARSYHVIIVNDSRYLNEKRYFCIELCI